VRQATFEHKKRVPETHFGITLHSEVHAVLRIWIWDPGCGAFLPPGSGSRINCFQDPAPFWGEIFLIITIHVKLSLRNWGTRDPDPR
jgi:hypothetical protein